MVMKGLILITLGYVIGIGMGTIIGISAINDNEDLKIRLCQEQGHYEVYDKVILCSVTTTEELIKRDLNGGG